MKSRQKIFLFVAFIVMIFIFYTSSQPEPYGIVETVYYISTIYHFGIFFILSSILGFAFVNLGRVEAIIVLLTSIFYAALDEMHQFYVPGRDFSLFDILVDSSGVVTGIFFVYFIIYLFSFRKNVIINKKSHNLF